MYSGGVANLSKMKFTNQSLLRKMAKNKQSNLIVGVNMLNIGFINKYSINSVMGGEAIQYKLITNHFSEIFFY